MHLTGTDTSTSRRPVTVLLNFLEIKLNQLLHINHCRCYYVLVYLHPPEWHSTDVSGMPSCRAIVYQFNSSEYLAYPWHHVISFKTVFNASMQGSVDWATTMHVSQGRPRYCCAVN